MQKEHCIHWNPTYGKQMIAGAGTAQPRTIVTNKARLTGMQSLPASALVLVSVLASMLESAPMLGATLPPDWASPLVSGSATVLESAPVLALVSVSAVLQYVPGESVLASMLQSVPMLALVSGSASVLESAPVVALVSAVLHYAPCDTFHISIAPSSRGGRDNSPARRPRAMNPNTEESSHKWQWDRQHARTRPLRWHRTIVAT
jgi:hypothetical protein